VDIDRWIDGSMDRWNDRWISISMDRSIDRWVDIFWVIEIEITWDFGHAPMDARRSPKPDDDACTHTCLTGREP